MFKILLVTALSIAGVSGPQKDVQESQNVNAQGEENDSELVAKSEQIVKTDSDLFLSLEHQDIPIHSDLPKRGWQYFEISFNPSGIPGAVGYGYRSLHKVHGWDASLHLDYFSVVFVPDFGSFIYQAVSSEFSYLPNIFFKNIALYFGIGGGGGVGRGLFGSHQWELFPILYLKPGVQFALDKSNSKMLSIDLKAGFPNLISLSSGIAF